MNSYSRFAHILQQFRRTAIIVLSFILILLQSLISLQAQTSYVASANFQSRVVFGTAINSNELTNPNVTNTLSTYGFSSLTPGYEAKMGTVKYSQHVDNYAPFDAIVDYAMAHNMQVHGHTLVWGEDIPGWVTSGSFSKEQYKAILQDYVTKTIGRYCGRVATWDVVNEAFDGSGGYTNNFWYQKIGPEYVALSYQWARTACPSAKLYYNDLGIENKNTASDALYNKVVMLRAQGITIDGIGLETHDGGNFGYVNAGSIKDNMARFASIGVEVAISEIDEQVGTPTPDADQLTAQANRYRQIAQACIESSNCVRFTTWGLSDPTSWINTVMHRNDAPLLFDANYQPKPAYFAVKEALTGQVAQQPVQPTQPSEPAQPTPATAQVIGSHDDMRNNTLRGWACNTTAPADALTIDLFTESGALIGEALANQSGEAGIGELCSGYANHRFTLPIPQSLQDGLRHTIYAKAKLATGELVSLNFNEAQTIQVGTPISAPQPVTQTPVTSGELVGYHDQIITDMTFGWACDPDNYAESLRIDFYADGNGFGTFLGSTYASVPREAAVGALCGGNSSHGFSFQLPATLKDGQLHTIYAYGINIGSGTPYKLLGNSPKTYQAAPPVQAQPAPQPVPAAPSNSSGNVTITTVSRDCSDALMHFSF